MTPQELDAIKGRAEIASSLDVDGLISGYCYDDEYAAACAALVTTDVPALIADVERLLERDREKEDVIARLSEWKADINKRYDAETAAVFKATGGALSVEEFLEKIKALEADVRLRDQEIARMHY